MSADTIPVNIRILDKEYCVGCPAGERDELLASARYLDAKMREIRDSRKVTGSDRIAVICALNLAHELLQKRNQKTLSADAFADRVKRLGDKIESSLQKSSQLDLS
jgi:cell division protein ZapA